MCDLRGACIAAWQYDNETEQFEKGGMNLKSCLIRETRVIDKGQTLVGMTDITQPCSTTASRQSLKQTRQFLSLRETRERGRTRVIAAIPARRITRTTDVERFLSLLVDVFSDSTRVFRVAISESMIATAWLNWRPVGHGRTLVQKVGNLFSPCLTNFIYHEKDLAYPVTRDRAIQPHMHEPMAFLRRSTSTAQVALTISTDLVIRSVAKMCHKAVEQSINSKPGPAGLKMRSPTHKAVKLSINLKVSDLTNTIEQQLEGTPRNPRPLPSPNRHRSCPVHKASQRINKFYRCSRKDLKQIGRTNASRSGVPSAGVMHTPGTEFMSDFKFHREAESTT
ncbi:hypothetical protein DFH29DRAFT_1037689 [Suillus ampliporus]|nr:hypothetical protein DFH29DRAFT_1037689 [Suillus ampliporus]